MSPLEAKETQDKCITIFISFIGCNNNIPSQYYI